MAGCNWAVGIGLVGHTHTFHGTGRRLCGKHTGRCNDLVCRHPCNLRYLFNRIFLGAFSKLIESMTPFCNERFIIEFFFDNNVDHPEEQSSVCSGPDLQPQVGFFSGLRTTGVNNDELCTPFPGLEISLPDSLMTMGWITADEHQTACTFQLLNVHPVRPPAKKRGSHDSRVPMTDLGLAALVRAPEKVEEARVEFFVCAAGSGGDTESFSPVLVFECLKLVGDLI